jgi:hypothetical protein
MPDAHWNSLEIAKLAVGVLTPVMIFVLGFQVTEAARKQSRDEAKSAQLRAEQSVQFTRLIDKRVQLWERMAVPLNDVYAYMLQVGHWKDLNEADLIARKRQIDALVYANRPFFSDKFFNAYNAFMGSVFATYGAIGEDAALRTSIELQLRGKEARFTGEDNRAEIHKAYYDLLEVVADELNLKIERPPVPPSRVDVGPFQLTISPEQAEPSASLRRKSPAEPPSD